MKRSQILMAAVATVMLIMSGCGPSPRSETITESTQRAETPTVAEVLEATATPTPDPMREPSLSAQPSHSDAPTDGAAVRARPMPARLPSKTPTPTQSLNSKNDFELPPHAGSNDDMAINPQKDHFTFDLPVRTGRLDKSLLTAKEVEEMEHYPYAKPSVAYSTYIDQLNHKKIFESTRELIDKISNHYATVTKSGQAGNSMLVVRDTRCTITIRDSGIEREVRRAQEHWNAIKDSTSDNDPRRSITPPSRNMAAIVESVIVFNARYDNSKSPVMQISCTDDSTNNNPLE